MKKRKDITAHVIPAMISSGEKAAGFFDKRTYCSVTLIFDTEVPSHFRYGGKPLLTRPSFTSGLSTPPQARGKIFPPNLLLVHCTKTFVTVYYWYDVDRISDLDKANRFLR